MGLLPARLICPQRWQSLYNSGLDFVLLEPGSRLAEFVKSSEDRCFDGSSGGVSGEAQLRANQPAAAQAKANQPKKSAFTATGSAGVESEGAQAAAALREATHFSEKKQPASGVDLASAFEAAQTPLHASPQFSPQTPAQTSLQPAAQSWPKPWDLFALKTAPDRPFLWTHNELGQDLLAANASNVSEDSAASEARSRRSGCTRQLLSSLGLARLVNFWPMSLPSVATGELSFTPQAEMFLEGVTRLDPTFLLVLGPLALRGFAPEISFNPYTNLAFGDKVLLLLPCLNILSEDAGSLQRAISFLRPYTLACRR